MPTIDKADIQQALDAWAQHILDKEDSPSRPLALVGLISHGDVLARRLVQRLEAAGRTALYGAIDITLYRDDLDLRQKRPALRSSYLPFSTDDTHLILVDDVFHTGRTARAALEALFEYGRPAIVELHCLVDCGGRELPLRPDYVAYPLELAAPGGGVSVRLEEIDGEECIMY